MNRRPPQLEPAVTAIPGPLASPPFQQPRTSSILPRQRFITLLALHAVAVTQPLFVRLSGQTPFLLDTSTTPVRLLLLTLALYLLLPAMMWVLVELITRLAPPWGRVLQLLFVASLAGLLFLQFGERLALRLELAHFGIGGLFAVSLACAGAAAAVRWHDRPWMQTLLLIAACGSLLFPVQFLRSGAAVTVLIPDARPTPAEVLRPAPVVVVIFDEFSGMSLLNEQADIDAARYPNFARLARSATWYRNATTVHSRTNYAVPAILTGRLPLADREMTLAESPQNLFTLLHEADFATAAFEPVSRLCPDAVGEGRDAVPLTVWTTVVADTLWRVYLHAVIPRDFPATPPAIPLVWYGDLRSSQLNLISRTGISRDASQPDGQLDQFLATLPRPGERRLCLLHAMMPHCPWRFLPSGEAYVQNTDVPTAACGGLGPLNEDWSDDPLLISQAWQRYLLQVGDVDRRLGLIIDQLEANGVLDDCLLVVTGDHGVSFLPGHSRRVPDGGNLNDVLSVPLFIKLPGQQSGQVSDRNVESIDLFPTIADALGTALQHPVDGDSLLDETIPPRPRKTIQFEGGSTVVAAEFPQRYEAVDRMLSLFGSGTDDRLRDPLGPNPELIGRRIDEFPLLEPGDDSVHVSGTPPNLAGCGACYLEVQVSAHSPTSESETFAVVMEGLILGVVQTSTDPNMSGAGCCLLIDPALPAHRGSVQLYRILPQKGVVALQSCKTIVRHYGT